MMRHQMVAARLHRVHTKLRIDHVPIPRIGPDDVLLEVRARGICHSDINYREGIATVGKLPITLGHEIAGVVAVRGRRAKGLRVGERVLVHYVSSCGHCSYCKTNRENLCRHYQMIGKDVDGGFAEYLAVPASSLVRLPEAIPFEQGAIMGCAVATAYHALRRGRAQAEDTVIILGVGGLGMHAVQLAKRIFHARKVVALDRFDWKLKEAKRRGADATVNTRSIVGLPPADLVLDFVGSETTIRQGLDYVGMGGRLVVIGIGARSMTFSPYRTLIGKEIDIIGVDDHLKTELRELVYFVESRRLDLSHSITHRVRLEEINEGLRILEDEDEKAIRVAVSNED